jgi:hypothetical protein
VDTDAADDVWQGRDLVVLRAVVKRIDSTYREIPEDVDIASDTGLDLETVRLSGHALQRAGLVKLNLRMGGFVSFADVSGQAYRLAGLHPNLDELPARFLDLLRQAAEEEPDPQQRKALREFLRMGAEVSMQTLSNVLASLASRGF